MIPPKEAQVFECTNCALWLDEQGILCCNAKEVTLTVDNLRESVTKANELSKGGRSCLMVDLTSTKPVPKAVRQFVLTESKKYRALALISNSLVGSMVAKIFLSLASLEYPTKLFSDEKEAKEWLQQYL